MTNTNTNTPDDLHAIQAAIKLAQDARAAGGRVDSLDEYSAERLRGQGREPYTYLVVGFDGPDGARAALGLHLEYSGPGAQPYFTSHRVRTSELGVLVHSMVALSLPFGVRADLIEALGLDEDGREPVAG